MTPETIADRVATKVTEALRDMLFSLPSPTRLVTIDKLAQALGISVSTLRRMKAEGMPVEHYGTAERFDIAACREWARRRGKKSVTPKGRGRSATDGPVPGVTLKRRAR